jgi:hypothetical protein
MGSVGVIILSMFFGIWFIWKRYRQNTLVVTLGIGSLGYFGSLGLRLSSDGAELASRTWPFLFLAIGFTIALGMVETAKALARYNWLVFLGSLGVMLAIFMGGVTAGWPPYWGRLPGSYIPASFERSVDSQNVSAAKWAGWAMTPDSTVASDFTMIHLMGAYGNKRPYTGISWLFLTPQINFEDIRGLKKEGIDYLAVDRRMSQVLPATGYYFDPYEPEVFSYTAPLTVFLLDKFDAENLGLTRIYDSGDIVIYKIGDFPGGP